MANKISVTVDVKKIDKTKLKANKYTDKNGVEHDELNFTFDLVELNDQKTLKVGDTWIMRKTHFAAIPQTKEERDAKTPSVFLGGGVQFADKDGVPEGAGTQNAKTLDQEFPDSNPDEIPF